MTKHKYDWSIFFQIQINVFLNSDALKRLDSQVSSFDKRKKNMFVQVPLNLLEQLEYLIDSVPPHYTHVIEEIRLKLQEILATTTNVRTCTSSSHQEAVTTAVAVHQPLSQIHPSSQPTSPPLASSPQPPQPPQPHPPPQREPSPVLGPVQPDHESTDDESVEPRPRQIKRRRRRRVQNKIAQVLKCIIVKLVKVNKFYKRSEITSLLYSPTAVRH